MNERVLGYALAFATLLAGSGQAAPAGPRAPDTGVAANAEKVDRIQKAIEPLVKEARETYPAAKKRFLAGLPPGYLFEVVAVLTDTSGKREQVFIAVQRIADGFIEGSINNDVRLVSGFKNRDPYRLLETELVDWCITAPDGSEEGNIVGKWLETHGNRY
jgi:hypothetical protein